jgi:hypothetical protein
MKATLVPFVLLVGGGFFPTHGQTAGERVGPALTVPECKESKRAIGYDRFIESIKKGERGDGVHYPWMDKMRRLGIKQAFFVVKFSYKHGEYRYKVKSIDYLRQYYCYESEVKGGKLLREIRQSGLERELKEAILTRIKRYEKPYQAGNVTEGEEYRYLLDDEYLTIIDFVT